jgi:transformation/transcription domain-associated protein
MVSKSYVYLYAQCCAKRNQEHDAPIARYYERLATVQARGSQFSHQVLRDILKEVQANIVPRGLLKEWASHTFPNATDYWTFRKNVSGYFCCRCMKTTLLLRCIMCNLNNNEAY